MHHDRVEVAALDSLRQIGTAQHPFREGDKEADGFSLSGGTFDWNCVAEPVDGNANLRSFIICTDGIIRYALKGKVPDCNSAAVEW